MKYLLLFYLIPTYGIIHGQLMSWQGYDIYDYMAVANHPQGCVDDYVTGLPNDSTWVNMVDNSVMTGYFNNTSVDQPGYDLLLETSYHNVNYNVRMILSGGTFSASVNVVQASWTQIPDILWKHLFATCTPGQANSTRWILPMDFTAFGLGPGDLVTGIEITFLFTTGAPDLAGVYILVPPCGNLSLGPDVTVCAGETTSFDATIPGATGYLWQDGTTSAVYPNAGPGAYWVEVTIDDCTLTDDVNVLEAVSLLDLGDDQILCEGESLVLDATQPGATYQWQNNSTQPTFTVTQPGNYSVTTTENGCMFSDNIQVDYIDLPTLDLGNDTTLCNDAIYILDATLPGATYEWQDNSTAPTFFVSVPGTYSVTVSIGDCTAEDEIEVSYIYLEPDLGEDLHLCSGENITLNAFSSGASYEWQDNSSSHDYFVEEPGTYSVTVTLDNCDASDEVDITYSDEIEVDLGDDIEICTGTTIFLDATTPGATYEWQDNSTSPTLLVDAAGNYSVTVTVGECTASDNVQVDYGEDITIDLGIDTNLCFSETLLLDASIPGATYQWQDNSTSSTFLVTSQGTYSVTVSVGDCTGSDIIQVNYTPQILVDLGIDTTLCSGQNLLLDVVAPGATYLWQDNSTSSSYTVTTSGTYTVQVNVNGCIYNDMITATYLNAGDVNLGPDTTLCQGELLTLDVNTPDANYHWHDNSTSSTLSVDQPGDYWVQVSVGNCVSTDSIHVDYLMISSIYLGNDTTLCSGDTLLLDAHNTGANFLWQDLSTGSQLLVEQAGTYWVEVSLVNCHATDTIQIEYNTISPLDLGNDTTLCTGETILLQAIAPGASYTWQDNSSGSSLLVTSPGLYWVTAQINNCSTSDTIDIAFASTTSIDLGHDTTLCEGQILLLDASLAGASYLWNDNSSGATLSVTQQGSYWVQATVGQCSVADTIEVDYLVLGSVDLGNDTTLCFQQSLLLDVSHAGSTYVWQDNSVNPVLNVTQPGMYWVTVFIGACEAHDTIDVSYTNLAPSHLGNDTTLCTSQILQLDASTPGANYVWQDGSMQSGFMVTMPGSYHVTVSIDQCEVADTIQVAYLNINSLDLGSDTTLCSGQVLTLVADAPGAQYLWSDNSNASTLDVTQSGIYWLQVNLNACAASDTILVDFSIPVSIDLGPDTILCNGETLLLDVTTNNATYVWQDNSTVSTYSVVQSGIYTVTVDREQCSTADSIRVNFADAFLFDLGEDQTICDDTSFVLDPQIPDGIDFFWQDNSTTKTFEVTGEGLYWLQVEDDCGIRKDSVTVFQKNCHCPIYVANIFSPNGDQVNDHFTIQATCPVTSYQLIVFDRDGGLVFETKEWGTSWDGNVKNKPAQVGVYAYLLQYRFEGGEIQSLYGDVTLVR